MNLTKELYENGFSCLDIIEQIEDENVIKDEEHRLKVLMHFYKVKGEYRNEKLLMFYMFNIIIYPDLLDK